MKNHHFISIQWNKNAVNSIVFFLLWQALVFQSCQKFNNTPSNDTNYFANYVLDSITTVFLPPELADIASVTEIFKSYPDQKYALQISKFYWLYSKEITSDTTFYYFESNNVYSQNGINGSRQSLGAISSNGYLLNHATPYAINTVQRQINTGLFLDTIAKGATEFAIDTYGRITTKETKDYKTSIFGTTFPLGRVVYHDTYRHVYDYNTNGLQRMVYTRYTNWSNQRKISSSEPWKITSYIGTNVGVYGFSQPFYIRLTHTYKNTSIIDPMTFIPVKKGPNFLFKEEYIKEEHSTDNVNWIFKSEGLKYSTINHVVDSGRLISYDISNNLGTIVNKKKFYYSRR